MIENHTANKIFDEFEKCYTEKAIGICPYLSKFPIHVYTKEQYDVSEVKERLPEIDWEDSPLACSMNKTEDDASSMLAVVVVDESCCELLGLTNEEIMASAAHEVGHIIFYFLSNKAIYDKFGEEIIADEYATRMGLGNQLKSALIKLKSSDLYPEVQRNLMRIRIQRIDFEMNHASFVDKTT